MVPGSAAARGHVHSTRVDGITAYYNVARVQRSSRATSLPASSSIHEAGGLPLVPWSIQGIVALDAAPISSESPKGPEKALQLGDSVWVDGAPGHEREVQNRSDKEARRSKLFFHASHQDAGEGGRKR